MKARCLKAFSFAFIFFFFCDGEYFANIFSIRAINPDGFNSPLGIRLYFVEIVFLKKNRFPTENLLLLVTFFPSSTFTFALVFPYRSSCVIFLDNKVAKKFRKLLFRDKIKKATFIHFFSLSPSLSCTQVFFHPTPYFKLLI